ncbi:MAG TPA: TRAP transporter large permease [Pelagibacterales bacterium]|nr:TRAP transporter large permease [Pelagibacterales bacterium]
MSIEVLILIFSFITLLLLNVPIAFCIGIPTTLVLVIGTGFTPAISTVSQQIATAFDSFTLLAIPFFILSGNIMATGGIAKRLIDFAKTIVGGLPGGLALVNIVSAMLFGAVSGSAIASAAAIGSFMHPRMIKDGYDPSYSAAVNVTSATTGLIIPPSNVLIVYSLASGGVSIGALFVAGYLPGILVGVSLMIVASFLAYKQGFRSKPFKPFIEILKRFFDALLGLTLIIIIIGGIIFGIFTATEAASIAVVYAFVLTIFIYKEIGIKDIPKIFLDTAITTGVVMLLIGTSMSLSWVLSYANIPQNISIAMLGISENPLIILLIMNIILLMVGTFMDMTPAILIFTPIFLPIATAMGIDPLHFGIMMVVNLCIGLCTPPVGTVLFVGCGVAKISISQIVKPLLPFYFIMVMVLILIIYFPGITLVLPQLLGM